MWYFTDYERVPNFKSSHAFHVSRTPHSESLYDKALLGLPRKATAGRLRHRRTKVFLNSPISEAV